MSFEEVTDSDDDDDDDYVDCNMAPLAVAKSQVITAGPSDNVTIFVQNYPGRQVSTKDQDLMLATPVNTVACAWYEWNSND